MCVGVWWGECHKVLSGEEASKEIGHYSNDHRTSVLESVWVLLDYAFVIFSGAPVLAIQE